MLFDPPRLLLRGRRSSIFLTSPIAVSISWIKGGSVRWNFFQFLNESINNHTTTYKCRESCKRMQLVLLCSWNSSYYFLMSLIRYGNQIFQGSIRGLTYLTVTNSHLKRSNFILLSSLTSKLVSSFLFKLFWTRDVPETFITMFDSLPIHKILPQFIDLTL